ncbi:hypothetical protein [Duffyella gerundensis]|uniref:hypothetical protein n=1 Tax=Duffyella gerundensis TaxID=1619313 RepID=UPI0016546069|nr:hypothetical protein [Duffyella gerundensis]
MPQRLLKDEKMITHGIKTDVTITAENEISCSFLPKTTFLSAFSFQTRLKNWTLVPAVCL